jgi:hypothetical protein
MSGYTHLIGSRPTDGGEILSLMLRPSITVRKITGTHLLEVGWTPWLSCGWEAGRLGSVKNPINSSRIEPTTFRITTWQFLSTPDVKQRRYVAEECEK